TDELWSRGVKKFQTLTSHDGDRTSVDPPAGGTPATTFLDARGRATALWQYQGSGPTGGHDTTAYKHDLLGRLTKVTDAAGNDWSWRYDLLGRQIAAVDPDKGATTMTYTAAGELETTKDARNITLAYTYDDAGRKETLHRDSVSGPVLAAWTYDTLAKGQLTSSTRYDGGKAYTTAVTGYDEANRPLGSTVTVPAGEGALTGAWTSAMTYHAD